MNSKETSLSNDIVVRRKESEKTIRIRELAQRLSLHNFAVALKNNIAEGIYSEEEQIVSRRGVTDVPVAPLAKVVAESLLSRLQLQDRIELEFDTTDEVNKSVRDDLHLTDPEIEARRIVLSYRWAKPLQTISLPKETISEAEQAKEQLERVITETDWAKEDLAKFCEEDVSKTAERYIRTGGYGSLKEELISAGNIGLARALPRFDWRQGYGLNTFIGLYISGEMVRYIRNKKEIIPVPKELFDANSEVDAAIERTTNERKPLTSSNLLAAAKANDPGTELTEELIYEVQVFSARVKKRDSLDRPISPDAGVSIGDNLSEDSDDKFALLTDLLSLSNGEFKRILPSERDRIILYERFFNDRSQREIGDEIGMSQMNVSRILTRVLGSLREALEAKSDLAK